MSKWARLQEFIGVLQSVEQGEINDYTQEAWDDFYIWWNEYIFNGDTNREHPPQRPAS